MSEEESTSHPPPTNTSIPSTERTGGSMDVPSADLMARWRDGDEEAAEQLFHRYAERLLALARSRMSVWLAGHVDPEDVVQSAYRSFFTGARAGRFALERNGDLWRLL